MPELLAAAAWYLQFDPTYVVTAELTKAGCRAIFIAGFACVCWGWGNRPLCAAIAAWGLATAVSRALMGRHYLGDVAAGTALGLVTTALVTQVWWLCKPPIKVKQISMDNGLQACSSSARVLCSESLLSNCCATVRSSCRCQRTCSCFDSAA